MLIPFSGSSQGPEGRDVPEAHRMEEGRNESPMSREMEPLPGEDRGVEVQEKPGVYVFTYSAPLELADPYSDYLTKRRIYDADLAQRIHQLLEEEAGYEPEFKAKCLPKYDYGIVIKGEESLDTYLFAFGCNTMYHKEKKLWKDFGPVRNRLYTLLRYEVNDNTSTLLDSRE